MTVAQRNRKEEHLTPPTPPTPIVLATLNARYIHTAFGLRYLQANLGDLQPASTLLEFTTQMRPLVIAQRILDHRPRIVGLGMYIWNTRETLDVITLLKCLDPEVIVVLGGPEISHEWQTQPHFQLADHIVIGEGENAFRRLCAFYLQPEDTAADAQKPQPHTTQDSAHVIHGGQPDLTTLKLPYNLYSDADIAARVLYVEASRGCPYRCEFCLSALDKKVRQVPLQPFLDALQTLLDRGARSFKFVDRTFNLSPKTSQAILRFFLDKSADSRFKDGLFLHFEMVPDRFPEELRQLVAAFAPGVIQFEVGVQSLDATVCRRISRLPNFEKLFDNLDFLTHQTGVHVHADLIVGLPGEDLSSFGRGFDRLHSTGVEEIQVGILKRLRGAPISQHTALWQMCYSPLPPYEILKTKDITAVEMEQMRHFSRYWELFSNSGRFHQTLPLLLATNSTFQAFFDFSCWLHGDVGQTYGVSLKRCIESIFRYLTEQLNLDQLTVAETLAVDYRRVSKKPHIPEILLPYLRQDTARRKRQQANSGTRRQRRQQRHLDAIATEPLS